MNCNLNFWSISEFTDFAKFQQELIEYKTKVNKLDRIQISQGVDLKKILPILWQEIFQYHKDLNIRFFLNGHFDVQWIADFCELQNITIETWQEIKNPHELSKFKNLKSLNLEANFKQMGNLDFLALGASGKLDKTSVLNEIHHHIERQRFLNAKFNH